jgi:hypothetical protein
VTVRSEQRRTELGMEFDIPAALNADADFSSQYEHNLPRHDLRGGIPGRGTALGSARTATLALHYIRKSGPAATGSL